MKKILVSLVCMNLYLSNAQEKSKSLIGKVGITLTTLGKNDVIIPTGLVGSPGYNSDYFYTIGLMYIYPFNKWLEGETGIEYSKNNLIIHPQFYTLSDSAQKTTLTLINLPISLRANFLKYFFVNGGLLVSTDNSTNSSIDSQSGIGALAGVSLKYDFDCGITLFANPYIKQYAILPFRSSTNEHLSKTGIRVGITYNLQKIK